MRRLVGSILLVLLFHHTNGQHLIHGVIRDADQKTALSFATVFVSNSTYGAVSDEEGKFSLQVPQGQFQLVVSYMGYSSKIILIDTEILEKEYLIELEPHSIELAEELVEDTRDKDWYKNLKIFERFFLGNSKNAKKTKILNPEVLILDDQSKPGTLIAKAREPLEIENTNLGYKLTFVLTSFECREKEKQWTYLGFPYFEEMDMPLRQMKRVEKNRERALNGSLTHFFRALHLGDFEENGFEVYPVIHKKLSDNTYEEVVGEEQLDISVLVKEKEGSGLVFNYRQPIFVLYLNESEEPAYKSLIQSNTGTPYQRGSKEEDKFHQTSKLILQGRQVRLFQNGSYYNPIDLYVEGYMAWEGVGDMMPVDYIGNTP